MRRNRRTVFAVMVTAGVGFMVAPAAAHPHQVDTRSHTQVLANGQNHPGFQPVNAEGLRLSCAGTLEPANSGPAGYGLETAHHGPDAGRPGKADGCYATEGDPVDRNPAID
ncbi:MAG TPA: hypothetical protein VGR26_14620 [Acidimicrobiales bacterium]|nr:hypothetical protein [Acidimicrobiales bacterium]